MSRITRSSLHRFDRYTLDVFNAGSPYERDPSAEPRLLTTAAPDLRRGRGPRCVRARPTRT